MATATETEPQTDPEYTNGNPENGAEIESRIRDEVASEYPLMTFETVREGLYRWVDENVDVVCEPVPIDHDTRYDEVYFSDPIDRVHKTESGVEFVVSGDSGRNKMIVHRLKTVLSKYGLSTDVVERSYNTHKKQTRVTVSVPLWTDTERDKTIKQETERRVSAERKYRDVDEDSVVGECPRDGCDGRRYEHGMGSVGPRYKCTRKACGFTFERDVL